jgi:(1->4)-alpha-D-glucan 1-alpha-D-glucosylmutase
MTMRPRHIPLSTYRLQVHRDFPLATARDIVPYLARLGVGDVYTSPYFTAEPGSTHGYDVCNHNEINPEVGGREAHNAFTTMIAAHGMGHVVDFVPNHMGINTSTNAWWRDLLENGPSAAAAPFFDVDWTPIKPELQAKLLVPILGDQYGRVLEKGELKLVFRDGALALQYFEQELPINPRQAPRVYRAGLETLQESLGSNNPQLHEFLSILSSLENMPPYTESNRDRVAERQREKEVARGRLARLAEESAPIREHIEAAVQLFNGAPGRPESFDLLHELLESQVYRLAYWRTASHEINYRRFFDINTLAGLRVEVPEVFQTTHALLGELLSEGRVTGVRIDHPDGLFDPGRYFDDLQSLAARVWATSREQRGTNRASQTASDAPGPRHSESRPLYVVAEKILSVREHLPSRWAVHGTTGYNFLNDLNGLFVDGSQARRMRRVYARLTGHDEAFDDVLYASKRLIMTTAMTSELNVLAHMLDRIGESNRKSRDFTLDSMREVITEVVACFPVYRTYVDESGWSPEDRAVVEQAIARARRRNPAMEASLFDFFREVVLPRDVEGDPRPDDRRGGYPPATAEEARDRRQFAMKLQQYTGPVQAKGLEDTAFYRYNLLLSLNEVGGDPARFGRSVTEFHEANANRLRDWPFEMLTTTTHDTKLSEDVRARLNVLSEMPEEWGREASRWMRANKANRTLIDGEPAPDRNDEYRFYQALVGAWPLDVDAPAEAPRALVDRLKAYMLKAVRESKMHTSWVTPNDEYEQALADFIERVLTGAGAARFLPLMLPFQRRIANLGMVNSLAQTVLKIGSPGVPDFYQGTELWDLSLVDPDNRRPVDFSRRESLLAEVEALDGELSDRPTRVLEWLRSWADGRIKLLVTAAGLKLRAEQPALFQDGDYVPLDVQTSVDGHIAAFARTYEQVAALFVAPRLSAPLSSDGEVAPIGPDRWKTSRVMLPPSLADRTFRHLISGAELRPTVSGSEAWLFAGQVFEVVPVGILLTA